VKLLQDENQKLGLRVISGQKILPKARNPDIGPDVCATIARMRHHAADKVPAGWQDWIPQPRITPRQVARSMFSYVSLGTRDLARAMRFYDAVLAPLGHVRIEDYDPDDSSAAWGQDDPGPHLWVTRPFDGNPASVGNGTMVSFLADSRAAVDAFYAAALANGGTDEGPPGLRPQYGAGFYAGYVRDPDGNKLNAVCYRPATDSA
jgi:catechol 2,3-dioxygenase-like lactoylglutathione lyase family enzyme